MSEFYHPIKGHCGQCGWWGQWILSNHGAGADLTAAAVLKPFDLRSPELTVSETVSHLSKKFSDVRIVAPRRFEEVIAEVYRKLGWRVVLTKQSRDGGIDLYCTAKNADIVCIVECKRYSQSRKIDVGLVDRLLGVSYRVAANQAHLVTTSSFTRPALDAVSMAVSRGINLHLVDAPELARMINSCADRTLTVKDVEGILWGDY